MSLTALRLLACLCVIASFMGCLAEELTDGTFRLEFGRYGGVQVYYNGTWGTVCDDGFQMEEAHMVCISLGYTQAKKTYGPVHLCHKNLPPCGPILLDDLSCPPKATSVSECDHNGWGEHNCGHHQDIGVVCSDDIFCIAPYEGDNCMIHPCDVYECPRNQFCYLDRNDSPYCGCPRGCYRIYRPVCGSDGQTYDSPCYMEIEACESGRDITVQYRGECGSGWN